MNGSLFVSMVAGLAVLAASFCVGTIEILSAPERVNYPTSRLRVRVAMFAWAVFLGYRGLEMMSLATQARPEFVTPGTFYASVALLLAQAALLEQHLRSWLPAHTHQRIKLLMDIASCRTPGKVRVKGLNVRITT